MKTAVLLVNIGTPKNASRREVTKFLFRFLNDKNVITLPFLLRALLVNLIIIPFRVGKSAKRYQAFFQSNKPSLTDISLEVANKLNILLSGNYTIFAAMLYSEPTLQSVLNKIHKQEFDKVILIPQFPQYAGSTTGSTIKKFIDITSRQRIASDIDIIANFHNNSLYIKALSELIQTFDIANYDHVLFSYHSLPLSHIKSTSSSYPADCTTTTELVAQSLNLSTNKYSTCYQSHMQARGWLTPFTNDELIRLAHEGKKRVLITSPGLVADCLETTHELAIESAELFYKHGGQKLDIVPALNSSNSWIKALAQMVQNSR